jgi:hypothetical protein
MTSERAIRSTRSLVLILITAFLTTNTAACTLLDKVEKVSKTPGLEEVLEREANKKEPGRLGEREPVLSRLQATPPALDFGNAAVASQQQRTVQIFNPSQFPVTVIRMTVEGVGFTLASGSSPRVEIPARGRLDVGVMFQPPDRRVHSGLLFLEIDSAGGRDTRVVLTGKGI